MATIREMLEAKQGKDLRALIERLEAQTKTGVTLRVLPGGMGGAPPVAPQPERVPQPTPGAREARREVGGVGVPIGQTVERNGLRMHRYSSALRVTDLANAGKRGKQVDEFALYNLDYSFSDQQAGILERALGAIAKARTYAQALQIAKEASAEVEKLPGGSGGARVEQNKYRGIDVEAPEGQRGAKIKIETPEFSLEASATDFSVNQKAKGLEDTSNHIPPSHGAKKTAIAQFYAWVAANEAQIRRMKYHELTAAMADADLNYHTFSTYD